MRIKKIYELGDYKLIQYQILQHNITRTVWQTVRRITNEILGVKGLIWSYHILKSSVISYRTHSQQTQNLCVFKIKRPKNWQL